MPPRTIDSLAHALAAAPELDAALVALAESLAELDRDARLGLFRADSARGLLVEGCEVTGAATARRPMEVALAQLPSGVESAVQQGGAFIDVPEDAPAFARMLRLPEIPDAGYLALRGVRLDGQLAWVLAVYESRRVFGVRVAESFAPLAALFDLAILRFAEREARREAVRTLEEVTQRVHEQYDERLAALAAARGAAEASVAREREQAREDEERRRTQRRAEALEQQVTAAVGQLEQAHIELHRRSENLRQRTRTLYLIDRVLALAATQDEPRRLAEGLLALVGDDLQAQRCSLFLRDDADPGSLYLAAARGLAPHVTEGRRIKVGEGVAGRVAATREPLLVVDASDAAAQPLLGDQYLTTGSFIVFPLMLRGELIGVVNLTNRVQRGLFVDEDVDRVRLLGLVISLVASEAALPQRLAGTFRER